MIKENLEVIRRQLTAGTKLVAVSKFHSNEKIMQAYEAGQKCFGESRPQEFEPKVQKLPEDIEWHFIGHLQRNKRNMVLPYADLVESVDSLRLLNSIDDWGRRNEKVINVLLQYYIAEEDTKQGLKKEEILNILSHEREYANIRFCGLMGMATNTDNIDIVRNNFAEIAGLKKYVNEKMPGMRDFKELSIGMSGDWKIALEYGATIIRIGTAIFGPREY